MRNAIANLEGSRIREVANAGLGRQDVLAFWFGESDESTPLAVREAAAESLLQGDTFYAHNLGMAGLREALAAYTSALHGPVAADRIAVTSSGVNALMLAMQLLIEPGDEVVAVVPLWPNLTSQAQIMGARVQRVALSEHEGKWSLDLDRLLRAITPSTRTLLINAPNNPTGWTLTQAEQTALLAHCRRTGTWIVADEVYERLYYGEAACAPSFLDVSEPQDRLIVVHSFSKSFLMTGWRLGWMVVPPNCVDAVGKLIEFNTSSAPVFVQKGALKALQSADRDVPTLVARMRHCRDTLATALAPIPGIRYASPLGGMYVFLQVPGTRDSLALAKRLVQTHGLGLAPGCAFGSEAQGWLRWCFASRQPERLAEGASRLSSALRVYSAGFA
jgi:aspartate/methionine/tyrosine aminotransferase